MRRTAQVIAPLLGTLLGGCYESLDFGAAADGGAVGQPPEFDWSRLDPPDNIDIAICGDLVLGSTTIADCEACCEEEGFPAASFIRNDHCTCGHPRTDDREMACAGTANEQGPSVAECDGCCQAEGYVGFEWSGAGGFYTTCICNGVEDSFLCRDTLDDYLPESSCHYCCLQNGFPAATFRPQNCECTGP